MTCVICKHGEPRPGRVTVTFDRGSTTVIFRNVPADVCENCGEYYLSDEVTATLLDRAEQAARNGAELEILRYAA